MSRTSRCLTLFPAAVFSLASVGCSAVDDTATLTSVPAELVVSSVSPEQAAASRLELQRSLNAQRVARADEAPVAVALSRAELRERARVEQQQRTTFPGPKLVGVTESVRAVVDFASLGAARLGDERVMSAGAARADARGGFVWTGVVRAEGARALRIHFAELKLGPDAELYVYNAGGEAYGPFTDVPRSFWSPSLAGSEAYVQVYGVDRSSRVVVDAIGHIDPLALDLTVDPQYNIGSQCYEDACVENAACNSWQYMSSVALATAHLQFIDGPYIYICSGGLVADSDSGSNIPYLLTANHCISRQSVADTLETFFQFDAACSEICGNAEVDGIKVGGGATLLSTNSSSDYTFMRLAGTPPGTSVFLGWNTAEIAYTNGASLHRMSHPSGGPVAYSEHRVDTAKLTCRTWPRGDWIYSADTLGATAGGSSGSPVLNAQAQIVGQLSGACGTNVNNVCDAVNNATVDGAFARYYPAISSWLAGGAVCADADGDGYEDAACGGTDCDDANASVHPGAVEACNGTDDNCDGTVDEGCGGTCVVSGGACVSDAECCSAKCFRRGTCR